MICLVFHQLNRTQVVKSATYLVVSITYSALVLAQIRPVLAEDFIKCIKLKTVAEILFFYNILNHEIVKQLSLMLTQLKRILSILKALYNLIKGKFISIKTDSEAVQKQISLAVYLKAASVIFKFLFVFSQLDVPIHELPIEFA